MKGCCELCGRGMWIYARCPCGEAHTACFACAFKNDLLDPLGAPVDGVRTFRACPAALKVAGEAMGVDLKSDEWDEPECPTCGPTEWVCAMFKRVCAMCDADYPERATA